MTWWPQLGRTLRYLVAALVAGLHFELLIERIGSKELFDPLIALKWLAAAGLLIGFVLLHRRRHSLWRSRTALVIWLIVALVHGVGAPIAAPPAFNEAELIALAISTLLLATPLLILLRATQPTRWSPAENPSRRQWCPATSECGLVPRPPPCS